MLSTITNGLTQLAQTTTYYTETTEVDGLGAGALFGNLIFNLIFYVLFALCYQKIFQKAGREDSWAAWVPFYNVWVMFEVAGKPGWWMFLMLVPFVNIVVWIIMLADLAKAFGKGMGWTLLLLFLPIIGFPMLAWGDAQYSGEPANSIEM